MKVFLVKKSTKTVKAYSDESLMEKVKGGHLNQMALLFERYHKEIYHFFFKLCQCSQDSKDLTQLVFYRMIKYKNTYEKEKTFRTWMYRIARNVWYDFYKKKKRFHQQSSVFSKNNSSTVISEDDNLHFQQVQNLEYALKKLPYEQQEILVLHFYQEIKANEIAEILQISPNNARVKTHRAIKALRKEFKKLQ